MKPIFIALLPLLASLSYAADTSKPLLLQKPTVNKTHIVFSYAGDLWRVARDGGEPVRLTAGAGIETNPIFSPDGESIAFEGEYDGNLDVYVMPAAGGEPKRLTWHPLEDRPVGWTRDGKSILFRSGRDSYSRFSRLYTVPVNGGFPSPVDLPMAEYGAFSPDGKEIAYMPIAPAFDTWKRYRGGRTTPIWIARLSDAKIEKIPRDNSNDFNPMWAGDRIYFLSDRNGPVTLFAYDRRGGKVAQCIENRGLDLKSASAGPDAIAYEQFGEIHLYDLKSAKEHKIDIRISADIPGLRPTYLKAAAKIANAKISPTGVRAVFEAHGEILTVPVDKGEIRNLTNTVNAAERNPAWSPDGKRIAYFSDESGEYALHLRQQTGMGDTEKISLGNPPAFYYDPVWSPDSGRIAYHDSNLELKVIDLAAKKPVYIDRDTYDTPFRDLNPAWSPDSKWIAYTKLLKNHLRALFVYSVADAKAHQVSDGMSDAEFACFDKNGKYLYFTASTNLGLSTAWLDMSSDAHPVTRNVYMVVLNKDEPSPLAPESDEEAAPKQTPSDKKTLGLAQEPPPAPADSAPNPAKNDPGAQKAGDETKTPVVRIDFENIGQR
ncbi:MAG: protease, partial [Acidobacteriota bacterium]|nr:protease [Acidobacteriota bacterium]